jgi:prevent-host-death family protein
MSEMVSKSKFKARALEYLRRVEQRGEEIIVTDRGRPVAKVVPLATEVEDLLTPLRDSVLSYEDPTEPVGEDDWELG